MYKITSPDFPDWAYDSNNNPLPEGEVYFATHQFLVKDDVIISRIFIQKDIVKLKLGFEDTPLIIDRQKFQKLFMKDVPIVQLLCSAKNVNHVILQLGDYEMNLNTQGSNCYKLYRNDDSYYGTLYIWMN